MTVNSETQTHPMLRPLPDAAVAAGVQFSDETPTA